MYRTSPGNLLPQQNSQHHLGKWCLLNSVEGLILYKLSLAVMEIVINEFHAFSLRKNLVSQIIAKNPLH